MNGIGFLLFLVSVSTSPDAATMAKIDGVFSAYASPSVPGCAVGIARAGRVVATRAYGAANLEDGVALTPQSIFEIGSVSKQFTAAAVLLLEKDGKLSLDDRVRTWIPELPQSASEVTIREMLHHTSGLRDWGTVSGIAGWPRGSRLISHANVLQILSRQRELNFAPGSRYSYSNSNYNLAAMIVERASGKPFADFVRDRIFVPLGMAHSRVRTSWATVVPGRAMSYDPSDNGGYEIDISNENIYGNCCVLATVEDLLRWNDDFRAPVVGDRAFITAMEAPAQLTNGKTSTYALGLDVVEHHGRTEVAHSGATAGWRASLIRFPNDEELSVAVLCNRGDANPSSLAEKVADIFLPDVPAAAHAETPATAAEFTGLYRDPESDSVLRFFVDKGTLHVGLGAHGPALESLGGSRFRVAPTDFEFGKDSVRLTNSKGRDARFTRVAEVTAPRVDEYVGEFRSEEADATWRLTNEGGRLAFAIAPDPPEKLDPLDADAFHAGNGMLMHFTRGDDGRVNGFDLKTDFSMGAATARVERMHFVKR